MEKFDYFGLKYVILEDKNDEVAVWSGPHEGKIIIPKHVDYNGKTYLVTQVGHESYRMPLKVSKNKYVRRDAIEKSSSYTVTDWESRGPFSPDYVLYQIYDGTATNPANCYVSEVIMPDSISRLSYGVFRKCKYLKSVKLPHKITEIPDRAFSGCTALESCTLHEGIVSIGIAAFVGCKNLKEVSIPSSVKTIDEYAFTDTKQSLCGVEVVNIYNDEGNVIIHPYAFNERTKVNYLGKKQAKSSPTVSVSEEKQIDLDKLIDAVVADGVITEKERVVIVKKATAAGYDADEVEILLDGRLHEKQAAQKPVEKQVEKKKPSKVEVSKPAKEVTPKAADDSNVEWSELLWEPVKEELLKQVKVKLSIPKGKPYVILASENHKGLLQYILQYSVRDGEAIVRLETYGGEDAKNQFDAKIAASPAGHPIKQAVISQGQKNKDKWVWTIATKADKSDAGLVKWYVETLLAVYAFMEDITL